MASEIDKSVAFMVGIADMMDAVALEMRADPKPVAGEKPMVDGGWVSPSHRALAHGEEIWRQDDEALWEAYTEGVDRGEELANEEGTKGSPSWSIGWEEGCLWMRVYPIMADGGRT